MIVDSSVLSATISLGDATNVEFNSATSPSLTLTVAAGRVTPNTVGESITFSTWVPAVTVTSYVPVETFFHSLTVVFVALAGFDVIFRSISFSEILIGLFDASLTLKVKTWEFDVGIGF